MRFEHLSVELYPATGNYSVAASVTSRPGPPPDGFTPQIWTRTVRVPAGWKTSTFGERQADMYARARRDALKKFPRPDVVWEVLSPPVIKGALEYGSASAMKLLLSEFLNIPRVELINEVFGAGYEQADLEGDLFLWYAEWHARMTHARVTMSRKRQNTFHAFAQNKFKTLKDRLVRDAAREIAMSDFLDPMELIDGYTERRGSEDEAIDSSRELVGFFSSPTYYRERLDCGRMLFAHRPVWERPPLPVPVLEGPACDTKAVHGVIRFFPDQES